MGQVSGAVSYEQEHHRDYLNHTPLVPSASDLRWRRLEMFIWLSDVPEDHGPTHVAPVPVTAGVPALPHGYLRSERPDFYEHEVSGAGPAGTVVAYSTNTFHRGTEITAPRSARYSAHVSYRHASGRGPVRGCVMSRGGSGSPRLVYQDPLDTLRMVDARSEPHSAL